MSDYTKATNFAAKDSLPSGNAAKVVKGTEIDTEFNAIATAIATKADANNAALTGTPTAPTATAGDSSTQIATTAFVQTAMPAGSVIFVAMSSAPTGWLKANGAAVSRTTYATLFAAIGTTFGNGDGSTTFNLPDLRGEFLRGLDDGRGVDALRALGTAQADSLKSHTHSYFQNTAGQATFFAGSSGSTFGDASATTGSTGGTETRPRNVALLACIKY